MLKAIRWFAASVLVVTAAGAAMADDDSLLEKAFSPERRESVVGADADENVPDESAPVQPSAPEQGGLGAPDRNADPSIGIPAERSAPNAGPAVGNGAGIGIATGAAPAIAVPAPRTLFLGAGAIGPFGEPLPFATPRICIGESVLLKGAPCGAPIGRVVLQVDRLIFDAQIVEWAENGVHAVLPTVAMLGPTHGMLHVVRADGVLADTLPIILAPAK